MQYAFTFLSLIGFSVTMLATVLVRRFALKNGVIDDPGQATRKIHKKPIPLLGGVAVFIGISITMGMAFYFGNLPGPNILPKHVIGLLLGALWLVIGGYLDDRYDFSPKKQIIWPVLAVVTVIISGIGIESISNPLGGQWFLDQWELVLFSIGELPYKITLVADLFTFVWLMSMIYAMKFFDGLDGLVGGITIIGSFVVYFTSFLPHINQPDTALVALIVAACFAGFLIFNFYPASIFLGEVGSTLAGFLIGSLAILSEGKIVTTLVVMALPILDLIWVVFRRSFLERRSPTSADRLHIHHRLLDSGISHRGAVLLLYVWAILLALLAFIYQGSNQWFVLLLVIFAFVAFAYLLVKRARKNV